jgi:putative ABC transport system permease protein
LCEFIELKPYIFHINLYDLVLLGTLFTAINFFQLLWFPRTIKLGSSADRLKRFFVSFGLLSLLWIPYKAAEYFYYRQQFSIHAYDPLLLFLAATMVLLVTDSLLKPIAMAAEIQVEKPLIPEELIQKGHWLKQTMETGRYYQDAELHVASLAEKLDIHPRELSRIINTALQINFNDFVNEYRVKEVIRKMQDPANDRIKLLGMALDAGFNSKSTFNRAFRQMTGKNPAEYKTGLKKDGPSHDLKPYSHVAAVVSDNEAPPKWSSQHATSIFMFQNYLKIAWRNLLRYKTHTFINITGLSVGMAVAMLIGLWIWDELSYDRSFRHYDRLVRVMQHQTFNGEVGTQGSIPLPLGPKLRADYTGPGKDFKYVVMSTWTSSHIIAFGDKKLSREGTFMQPEAPEMFALQMLKGTRSGLNDPSGILLSAGLAKALFGDADPLLRVVKIDNKNSLTVTGVYEDLPRNNSLNEMAFMGSWDLDPSLNNSTNWGNNSWQLFAQLNDQADIARVSAHIKDLKKQALTLANDQTGLKLQPVLFVYPASKWHLYSEFKNGVAVGGKIEFVWLFGIIGIFVLLLACINFMNLSTARSEKRAREVGIRKTLGSLRRQLVSQFFSESLLVAVFAFFFCLIIVFWILPWFNQVTDKEIHLFWTSPLFWIAGVGFSLLTGVLAGSYPAFYLSSFKPVKVLKGTFRAGKQASLPRKVLVVVQFTASVALIIGTIVVFRQVQFTKNRQVGYSRDGMIQATVHTGNIHDHFDAVRQDLMRSGAVTDMAESQSPVTDIWADDANFSWDDMPSGLQPDMAVVGITPEFGKTVRWHVKEGRDFSRAFVSDSSALILNETAARFMQLKDPIGKKIKFYQKNYKVIGVVKDMVMSSPYDPVSPTVFYMINWPGGIVTLRLGPQMGTQQAVAKVETVFKQYDPASPFNYHFADTEYAKKFADEERIGKLAGFFTILAIFISCMGLFGMASFMAEQRVKEIGVRKVLGASITHLWGLMSKEFVVLVSISLLIAVPVTYYFMSGWLNKYPYHAELSWWIFAATAVGAMAITLLTVSYQSIKAALANPVKSLRSE